MSIALKSSTADFAAGPGYNLFPFVAQTDLVMGYDMSKTTWKTGLVGGQTATTKTQDFVAHTTASNDASWSRTLDGLGIHFETAGVAALGYTQTDFNTNDGVGRTFCCLGGSEAVPNAGGTTYRPVLLMGGQFAIGETMYASPNGNVGARVGGAFEGNFEFGFIPQKPDLANLIILRCNGNATWDVFVPNMARRSTKTNAQITGITLSGNTFLVNGTASAGGAVTLGRDAADSNLWSHPFRVYAAAIWGRALTDAEVAEQYQRLRLRFRGVLS